MATWTADDGSLINYEVHESRSSQANLLLLPGLLGTVSSQWRMFLPALAADFRVIFPDLRGHGLSENNQPRLLPEQMLADVVGLLDHVQVRELHVAGYSLGGYLGLMLALSQPYRVSHLIMHATKFYWTPAALESMQSQLNPDAIAQKAPAYAAQLLQAHGSRWRLLVRQASDLVAYLVTNGLSEADVHRLSLPVLVSVGDRDALIPLREAERLSKILRDGRLLVLPATRHPLNTVEVTLLLPTMQMFLRTESPVVGKASSSTTETD